MNVCKNEKSSKTSSLNANDLRVKKSVYRLCWGRLVANKPPIYYSKFCCSFWPKNLIFGTSGSLEKLENLIKTSKFMPNIKKKYQMFLDLY